MKKETLWTRNFTLVTGATICGAAGGIAGGFALSILVFDETQSTLASALVILMQVLPSAIVPLIASVWMDRLPRKPFLVGGDLLNALAYALAGLYLLNFSFNYIGYLAFSLFLGCLGAFDSLAYNSIYPKLIPKGFEHKGYSVSAMIYPVLQVIMSPVSAFLYQLMGVANILLMQGGLSLAAALIESGIRVTEENRMEGEHFTLKLWWHDVKEAAYYLRNEKGLMNIFSYMAVTNGSASGYSSVILAFFRTAPGFTIAMYSFFAVAEFFGRTIGGLTHYFFKIPEKKRFSFAFFVYMTYETMDMLLLWLPYPLMLANRSICGFLGINSATLREAAVQSYIPEEFRSRIAAFQSILHSAVCALLVLAVGALGEVLDYRICMTLCGAFTAFVCLLTIWRGREHVKKVYNGPEKV